jgi:hypothetical protein
MLPKAVSRRHRVAQPEPLSHADPTDRWALVRGHADPRQAEPGMRRQTVRWSMARAWLGLWLRPPAARGVPNASMRAAGPATGTSAWLRQGADHFWPGSQPCRLTRREISRRGRRPPS